jgi:hypothetical protein
MAKNFHFAITSFQGINSRITSIAQEEENTKKEKKREKKKGGIAQFKPQTPNTSQSSTSVKEAELTSVICSFVK